MRETLEKLAALWPKDSEFEVRRLSSGEIFFSGRGAKSGTARISPEWKPERFDLDSAAARTIIEDELIRLGFMVEPYYGPRYKIVDLIGEDDNRISGPNRETRTEALVDVAIQALEAAQQSARQGEEGRSEKGGEAQ